MEYDLSPLLTTIAGASASIVAIIGGFIASKLISISGDRQAVLAKISEVEQQQSLKQSELSKLQKEANEGDALDFIASNLSSLIQRKDLEAVYRKDLQYDISYETLRPYWNRALVLVGELANTATKMGDNLELNENDLPKSFAEKYSQDDFAYTVCKKVMRHIIKQNTKKNPYGLNIDLDEMTVSSPIRSAIDESKLKSLQSDVAWLSLQRQQLLDEKTRLAKPKGMTMGLIVFAVFTIICIIVPLSLYPSKVYSCREFSCCKLIIITVFTLALGMVFGYLIHLLRWDNGRKESPEPPKTP